MDTNTLIQNLASLIDFDELESLKERNKYLEEELAETNDTLECFINIIDIAGLGHLFKEIVKGTMHVTEHEEVNYIEGKLAESYERDKLYEKEVKSIVDLFHTLTAKDGKEDTPENFITYINEYCKLSFTYEMKQEHGDMLNMMQTKKGVCWHFANFFKDACLLYGIHADMIVGIAKGERHAWNSYILNGETYYCDVTWNIGIGDDDKEYLGMTLGEIAADHQALHTITRREYLGCTIQ